MSDTAELRFSIVGDGDQTVTMPVKKIVVAAYTGRDRAKIDEHIAELAAIGVAPPDRVPDFYLIPPEMATQSETITVKTEDTSGEVEAVLVVTDGKWYITVGSDHTDRKLEAEDMLIAKSACNKVLGKRAFRYEDLKANWDNVEITSATGDDSVPYQAGTLAAMLPLEAIVDEIEKKGITDLDDSICFLGTIPVIGGTFKTEKKWKLQLTSGAQSIDLDYRVVVGS